MLKPETPALRALVKLHEGVRLLPYPDTVGKLTIGVGRNLTDNGISEAECECLFTADLRRAIDDAKSVCGNFDLLDDVRQMVLADMAFNLGKSRLSGFRKFLAAVQRSDFVDAAREMKNSKWYQQVKGRGARLANMMLTGKLTD